MFYKKSIIFLLLTGISYIPVTVQALTLEKATYIAIENSPTVRQAIGQYRENKENTELARRTGYYPSVDLSAGLGHETIYGNGAGSSDTNLARRELTLSLTQPIFRGFANESEVERLRSEAEASRWQALLSIENTALDVAQVYANVLRYRELVTLAERNLETHERIFGQIKLKTDSGIGARSDLSQISARLAKANANHLAAINNLRDAESNYLNVVGELPPDNMIYPVPDRALLPQNLESAIREALAQNPAIEGAFWDVAATQSLEKIADSGKYPTINFILERTWNNNINGNEGASEDLLAMVRLNYNLYSGGSQQRQKAAAVQQNVQASEIRRKTIRDTELTVRLAWAAYEATTGQKRFIQQHVIATKESQVAYERQFQLGRRALLDVLDSENELFQARQDYVNADYDSLFSEFRLFNAKGELMRAFRIYRPELLGFNDEFDADAIALKKDLSTIEELDKAENAIERLLDNALQDKVGSGLLGPQAVPSNQPSIQESDLFLEADEESGSW